MRASSGQSPPIRRQRRFRPSSCCRDELGSRRLLLGALRATSQRPELQRLDDQMRRRASAIPIAWVVDARLVSPRLEGWREDVLGNVDYSVVKSLASSRLR